MLRFYSSAKTNALKEMVLEIKAREAKTLLDFGCGAGDFLCACANEMDLYQVGYDISGEALQAAALTCEGLKRTKLTRFLPMPPLAPFDVVTFIDVWPSLGSEGSCLSALHSIRTKLTPEGVLYAALPHPDVIGKCGAAECGKGERSLQELFTQLRKARFQITDLRQYQASTERKDRPFLVFVARPENTLS